MQNQFSRHYQRFKQRILLANNFAWVFTESFCTGMPRILFAVFVILLLNLFDVILYFLTMVKSIHDFTQKRIRESLKLSLLGMIKT